MEDRSGSDNSPNSLKGELSEVLGDQVTPELLSEKLQQSFDINRIKMSSFKAFRDRLEEVIA